jgi:high-affinity iron transporter
MNIARYLLLIVISLLLTSNVMAASNAEVILHSLNYIGIDYPDAVTNGKITNKEEYEEQLEFAGQVKALLKAEGAKDLLPAADRLLDAIKTRQPAARIRALTQQISQQVVKRFKVTTAPRRTPDLQHARQLYTQNCLGCHGTSGGGDGPLARGLTPAPTDFTEWGRQSERTLYSLFSTITQGVDGTAMRAFSNLNARDRWALAFYVGSFMFTDAQRHQGASLWQAGQHPASLGKLKSLSTTAPAHIKRTLGNDGLAILAFLRSKPSALEALHPAPLQTARIRMEASFAAAMKGDRKKAYQLALAAYLDGFELAESSLRAANAKLVTQIEGAMLEYRSALRKGTAATIKGHYNKAMSLLHEAEILSDSSRLTPRASFVSAMVILLREGLEAILILAAISSVLIKSGRRDALWYLHIGWIAAIALGVVTWYVSENIISISGSGREMTEGITALLATAVLLYVGFWLHGKTHAARWQQFINERIQKALHGGALWILASISFLAVYREIFETVLFYQALYQQTSGDAGISLFGGIATGLVLLALITWIILKTSLNLPLRLFFKINSAVMLLLAFTFIGHGIAGLQKAGVISVSIINAPEIGLLGIYPTTQTILAQVLLLVVFAAYFIYERRSRKHLEADSSS